MPSDSYTIDVGANCGDTLALMASTNTKVNFLCVEADKDLFGFLKTNSELVGKKINKNIFIVNALAGTLTHKVIMKEVVPGAKRAVTAGDNEIGIFSKPLDEMIDQYINNQGSKISLIKTDTDGYDYDVINSSHKSIATFKPILFLECFFYCIWQLDEYKKMIEELHGAGYNKFYIFDNFGAYILKTSSYQHINEILDTIWINPKERQQKQFHTLMSWHVRMQTNQ